MGHTQYYTSLLTFVTQQSTPVGVTHTLPGLRAGAMDTPREGLTLVAEQAPPTIVTATDRQNHSYSYRQTKTIVTATDRQKYTNHSFSYRQTKTIVSATDRQKHSKDERSESQEKWKINENHGEHH